MELQAHLRYERGKRNPKAIRFEAGGRVRRRACPPEDCGGPPGYEELVEIMKNPRDEQYRNMVAWLGGRFDPAAFDLQEANERLRQLG